MEIPPPNPAKMLETWMEWEAGETTPGAVMKALKTGGLRELLEAHVAGEATVAAGGETVGDLLDS